MRKSPEGTETAFRKTVTLPCACANLRRASRVVTQIYDEELRPTGLRATQFTLLQALKLADGVSQGQLGELLGMDSTTLTRTLALLGRKGCIRAERGEDRRQVRLGLTAEGDRQYRRALAHWQSAQARLRRALGAAELECLVKTAVRTVERVR